ncbi:DUF2232 domain-containing protein [Mammaliicoccus fleurettii]|uniref:DUF2232 domain-containing protein n=1 Tax=Mammaliicoccus fleurettii TaxID=150056 RepID=A0ABS5MNF2_9STAP|nr:MULTISPECIES: DUF2232 domain-containing protein [Mammaliicoccus]HCN60528.1 DUF2232 domain-containing protein [Staphylococcus sp.]MBL0847706.1 DUF2232 domain-containing protein [Mammaliicoccus fleurettii]MBS3672564.1 DUF2232 domain-containing protein [Mammaliicoccus fleurettii]MBS3697392.1 DUF2232 domain-containing protein [Mammaliicoccus fleurettii]MBW0765457.1 DUF2232 domain-containing protein [Mammaliicoccus fleurettii]
MFKLDWEVKNLSFKVDIKATIIATLVLVLSVVVMSLVPYLAIIILPFITIPGTILWYRSKPSFFVTVVVTLCATVLFNNVFLLTVMTLMIFMSVFIGQLLVERTSKERILYLVTTFMSILTIGSVLILQITGNLPLTSKFFSQYHDVLISYFEMGGNLTTEIEETLQTSLEILQASIPGYIVLWVFLLVFVNLLVTFPILRKFKVATPVFRPLFMWQINRSVAFVFVITVLISLFVTKENVVMYGIVTNLQFVLEWVIFIQALSLFHLFVKVKKLPVVVGVLIFVLAFVFKPFAYLFGLMDIWFNLKQRIKK